MNRLTSRVATSLFGLRAFVNLIILVGVLRLFANVGGVGPLEHLVLFTALFGAATLLLLMLPIVVAMVFVAAQIARGLDTWRPLAMRIVAAGLICDLFFFGGAQSWWIGIGIVSFDLALWALLAHVDARSSDAEGDAYVSAQSADAPL